MTEAAPTSGALALAETLSQPQCWSECLQTLEKQRQFDQVRKKFKLHADWLFVGCGSSYYVAQVAAASWTALTGWRARAVPASDLLLFPRLVLAGVKSCQPVLISRSGHTSEVLKAAEYLERKENIRTLAITCATHQPLEEISTATLYLPPADEKSIVMTRSFTSLLLGLQALGAALSNDRGFAESLRKMPAEAQAVFDTLPPRLQPFVESHDFADYVFLGQGPFFGLGSESMLKVKEMSCSYAQAFHTLEFRHGPKAMVSGDTLVTFMLSESGFEAEREVLEEIKSLGGSTLVIANIADGPTRRAADFLVELHLSVPEYARLAAYALTGQLLGLYTGVKKGLDPDRPRNLARVVVLSDKS